jgi:hypothetical protein
MEDSIYRIDQTALGLSRIGDLVIAQSGAHTLVTVAADGTERITIANTSAALIGASDFEFP